jgi:hypothetical protein
MSMKNSNDTPLGIDPTTFQFVAQCLNHYATMYPPNRNEYQEYLLGVKAGV